MADEIGFLGIGVQRGGTTWLWQQLHSHPGIWMPPVKELHYFDRSPRYPSPSHLATERLRDRMRQSAPWDEHFRRRFRDAIAGAVHRHSIAELRWMLRYYGGTYNDDWYRSLFAVPGDRLVGEISPSYAILDVEDIAHIRGILPTVKLLLLLRNPIERAWSAIRYSWSKGWMTDITDLDAVKARFEGPWQTTRGAYVRTLNQWSAHFPREQIFVGFYEDIQSRPQALLSDIFRFLGIDDRILPTGALDRRHNASSDVDIPSEIRLHLARKYMPELRTLSAELGGHADTWLKEAEEIVAGADHAQRA